ncbi:component of SufBCD complex [Sagittula sp. NFXS13]|uniref:component of SufBCD complex n=1 Tax=Sagittula sp. NFXS13 TaxID=2819095 RepID=UPI0032E028C0
MGWYGTVFEVIDMRSFSNLWFWIVLAVLWSSVSHWVLGVPFDMVARARRDGGQAEQDLEDLVRINSNRLLFIVDESGLFLSGLVAAFLTCVCLLGFVYNVETAQALFLLTFPMTLVALLTVYTSRCVQAGENAGEPLWRRLRNHRLATQVIGMISIFVTALWGMFYNLSTGIL